MTIDQKSLTTEISDMKAFSGGSGVPQVEIQEPDVTIVENPKR